MLNKMLLCILIISSLLFTNIFSDYVEEIFQTYMKASKNDLQDAATKLHDKTPAPMNTMLEKQPREEAVQKRTDRNSMVVKDVPPTTPGTSKLTDSKLSRMSVLYSKIIYWLCTKAM